MATRIRLRRMGANKRPFYRVVVADQRSPRDGRFIENIGKYHPLNDPSLIEIDEERAMHWLRVGAQPSDQVRNLLTKVGIWEKFVAERPSARDDAPRSPSGPRNSGSRRRPRPSWPRRPPPRRRPRPSAQRAVRARAARADAEAAGPAEAEAPAEEQADQAE